MKKIFKKVIAFIFIFSLILPTYSFAKSSDINGGIKNNSKDLKNQKNVDNQKKKEFEKKDKISKDYSKKIESKVENKDKNKIEDKDKNSLQQLKNRNVTEDEDDKWDISDFVVEGEIIYGFSQKGALKLSKNGNVKLPSKNGQTQITTVASFAFDPNKKTDIPDYVGREDDGSIKSSKDVDGFEIKNLGVGFNDTLLKSVTIPDGYKLICQDAFDFNKCLSAISLPKTITRISEYSFAHIALDGDLVLPSSLKTLGDSAFMGSRIKGTLTIDEALTDLGERTFKENRISNVVFKGQNITKLGEKVFEDNCITKITIPKSIKEIKDDAFNENSGDENYGYIVTLWTDDKTNPNNLKDTPFYLINPSDDKKVQKPDINYNVWDDKDFETDKNVLKGFSKIGKLKVRKNKNLTIPDEINGVKITEIADGAFRNIDIENNYLRKYDLETVVFPKYIEKIGDFAFQSNYLTEVDVQDNESLTKIGKCAFMDNKINTLSLNDGLKVIDDAAFHINSLGFVFLPSSIEKIGMSAFRQNNISNLMLLNCPNLTEIGEMAFLSNAIETLDLTAIPNLKKIGIQSFAQNIINDIKFPSGIEEIKEQAFMDNKIKEVNIPDSIKKIAFNAFDDNIGVEKYKKVEVEIEGKNKNNIPDGSNFVINVDEISKDRKELEEVVRKISNLNLDQFQDDTKKLFLDSKAEGESLLNKKDLREGQMLKYIFETNFLIDRSNIDILVKKAKESISKSTDKEKNSLLQSKIDYAEKNFKNSALTKREVNRLENELKLLTDLVNGTGEISKAIMVQGHHELKTPLSIPSYHIVVNVYFDTTGKILYVLDRSYDVGKGTKSKYGVDIENVDEDNAGYHKLALDTLCDYTGLYSKDILNNTVDSIGKIEKVEKAKYHVEGFYNAVKDACLDFKIDENKSCNVISLDDDETIRDLKLVIKKLDEKVDSLKDYTTDIFDIHFEKNNKEVNIKDKKFKVTIVKDKKLKDVKKVCYIYDDGKIQDLTFSQNDETVSFETTHFSKYALCYQKSSSNPTTPSNPTSPTNPIGSGGSSGQTTPSGSSSSSGQTTPSGSNSQSGSSSSDNSSSSSSSSSQSGSDNTKGHNKVNKKSLLPKTSISENIFEIYLLFVSFVVLIFLRKIKRS